MSSLETDRANALAEALRSATATMEEFGKQMLEASMALREFLNSMQEESDNG